MGEQLWTDDMIQDNAMEGYSMRFVLEGQIQVMRNHYQAALDAANERIRQLEDAQEWEPVEDGKLNGLTIDLNGGVIWLSDDDDMYLTLPANIRLCRRPQPQEQPKPTE